MKSLVSDLRSWWCDELAAFALVVAALFSFVVIFNARKKPVKLPLPPGPRGLPLLGYLPFLRPDLHRCFFDLSRTYGPIMSLRLGKKLCVVVSSPFAAREVLKEHDAAFANRDVTAVARAITYGVRDMVWSPVGPTWRLLRKVSKRFLNLRSLDALQSVRREAVRGKVAELRRHVGRPVEVREVVFVVMLRVITRMLWGSSTESEEEFRRVVDEIVELVGATNVSDFFPFIGWMDLQGVERRLRGSTATLDRILSRIIDGRLRLNDGGREMPKDLLQAMLEHVGDGDGDGEDEERLSVENIKALFVDLVTASTDTTSTTTEWVMAELIHNPKLMRRALDEIDTVVGSSNNGVVEESDLPQLRYIDAVVKEALRLHPTLPLLLPHCPSTDCAIGGYNIPKGTRVFINAWAIHRDTGVWREPQEFCPERFLEEEGGNWDYKGANGFGFLPFGSGRRICVGIPLADMMLKYVLATLLHSFEWRFPEGVEDFDLSDKFGIVLKKEKPLVVVPVPRFSDPRIYE